MVQVEYEPVELIHFPPDLSRLFRRNTPAKRGHMAVSLRMRIVVGRWQMAKQKTVRARRVADRLIVALSKKGYIRESHPRSPRFVVFQCAVDTGKKYFIATAAPVSECLHKGRTFSESITLDANVLLRRLTPSAIHAC